MTCTGAPAFSFPGCGRPRLPRQLGDARLALLCEACAEKCTAVWNRDPGHAAIAGPRQLLLVDGEPRLKGIG